VVPYTLAESADETTRRQAAVHARRHAAGDAHVVVAVDRDLARLLGERVAGQASERRHQLRAVEHELGLLPGVGLLPAGLAFLRLLEVFHRGDVQGEARAGRVEGAHALLDVVGFAERSDGVLHAVHPGVVVRADPGVGGDLHDARGLHVDAVARAHVHVLLRRADRHVVVPRHDVMELLRVVVGDLFGDHRVALGAVGRQGVERLELGHLRRGPTHAHDGGVVRLHVEVHVVVRAARDADVVDARGRLLAQAERGVLAGDERRVPVRTPRGRAGRRTLRLHRLGEVGVHRDGGFVYLEIEGHGSVS
jgi:hypothetical protein